MVTQYSVMQGSTSYTKAWWCSGLKWRRGLWGANLHSQRPKSRQKYATWFHCKCEMEKPSYLWSIYLFHLQLLKLVTFQDNYIKYRCRPSAKFWILYKAEPRMLFHFGFALSCVCTSGYICTCTHMYMSECVLAYAGLCVYLRVRVCVHMCVWCREESMLALHMEHVLYHWAIPLTITWICKAICKF